jgi:hypothetical protein
MIAPGRRAMLRWLAGYAALGTLVGLGALPLVVAAEPGNRPLVIRLAASVVLAVALAHIRAAAGRALEAGAPSAFDQALRRRRPAAPAIDQRFREALDDVRYGPASQRYWSRVAWPRLVALGGRLPGRAPLTDPPRSRLRRLLGLGPSLTDIRRLVARLEDRP